MVKFCLPCRKILPLQTKACPICGNSKLMRYCTNCHKMVPDGETECPICGVQDFTMHDKNKKRYKVSPFILGPLIFLVLVIITPYFSIFCILGHHWKSETCTQPRTCFVCGATGRGPLGHKEPPGATCGSFVCERCGKNGWKNCQYNSNGICKLCGKEKKNIEYTDKSSYYFEIGEKDNDFWDAITAAHVL